jgi:hypothetical protein
MGSTNDRRDRIRRTIRNRQREEIVRPRTARQQKLASILDELNAVGFLDAIQQRPPSSLLCFGSKAVHGAVPDIWSGVVIWYKPPGYHNYKRITLLGVWALGDTDAPQIIVGTRTLDYQESFYNAESYFYHLRRDFTTYYGRDASPPGESSRLFVDVYDPARRLELRRELESALMNWRNQFKR